MKKIIKFLFFYILVLYPILSVLVPGYCEDKIIAIVNQDVITQKDLTDFLSFMRLQLSQQYRGKELEEKLNGMKMDILNRLIDDRLILQEAKRSDIKIEDSRVRSRLSQIRKEYSSDAAFQSELMKQGVTQGDIEKRIREQFMTYAVIEQKIRSKIIVKPEEVTDFFQSNRKDFNTGEGKEFQAISLESEDLAKAVSYGLKSKVKFEELASRYPLTVNKILLRRGDELRKEILDVVLALSIDEISEPVKIDEKYYIFKLVSVIPARNMNLLESQERIKEILFEKKMQEAMTQWIKEIKKNSYIKVMND